MRFADDKPEDQADYDIGAQARIDDQPLDESQTEMWQAGWRDTDQDLKQHHAGEPT